MRRVKAIMELWRCGLRGSYSLNSTNIMGALVLVISVGSEAPYSLG